MTPVNKKSILYLISYSVLILMAGIYIGKYMADKEHHHRRAHWGQKHMSKTKHEKREVSMLKMFTKKLNLTEEQQLQVEAILTKHRPEMEAMKNQIHEQYKAAHKQFKQEINAILTEEQKVLFEKMDHSKKGKKNRPPH